MGLALSEDKPMFELQVFNHGELVYSKLADLETLCANDTEDCIDLVEMFHSLDEIGYYDFTMQGLPCRILDVKPTTFH